MFDHTTTTTPTRLPPDPRSLEGAAVIAVEALAAARAGGADDGDLIEADMHAAVRAIVRASTGILRRDLVKLLTTVAE